MNVTLQISIIVMGMYNCTLERYHTEAEHNEKTTRGQVLIPEGHPLLGGGL